MKKCMTCNTDFPDSMGFCPNCGARLADVQPAVAAFCPKCGRKNESFGAFCAGCGASLASKPAEAPPQTNAYTTTVQPQSAPQSAPDPTYQQSTNTASPHQQTAYQRSAGTATYTAPAYEPSATTMVNPVFAFLKSFAMSPLFLIAIGAFSLSVFITFIGNLIATSSAFDMARSILDMAGLGNVGLFDGVYDMMETLESSVVIGVLIGMAPQVLTVVGMWMVFANIYNSRREEDLQCSGFSLIRVIKVIYRVLMWIALIGIEVLLFLVVLGTSSSDSSVAGIVILRIMAVLGALMYFFIYYYNKIIDMLDNFIYVINTRLPVFGGITFVAVVSIIVGSLNALNAISSADVLGGMNTVGLLASGAANICFGVVLFRFNSEILNIRRESSLDL